MDGGEEIVIQVDGMEKHRLQIGGAGGDGFCYTHQSFDCLDNLSDEEKKVLHEC